MTVAELKPRWEDTLGFLCLGLGKTPRGDHNNHIIMLIYHFSTIFIVDEILIIIESQNSCGWKGPL